MDGTLLCPDNSLPGYQPRRAIRTNNAKRLSYHMVYLCASASLFS